MKLEKVIHLPIKCLDQQVVQISPLVLEHLQTFSFKLGEDDQDLIFIEEYIKLLEEEVRNKYRKVR